VNQLRKNDTLNGALKLDAGKWNHIVAVFSGHEMSLYVNGQRDGKPLPTIGLRTDERSMIGYGVSLNKLLSGSKDEGYLDGDLAMFRLLQRALTESEIRERYKQLEENKIF
jgi:hypothetical protein